MANPIANTPELIFSTFALIICAWIALDTRRALTAISFHRCPLSARQITFHRFTSGAIAVVLSISVLAYLLHG